MILEAPGNPTLEPNPAASQVSPRGNCRGQSCAGSPRGAPLAPTPEPSSFAPPRPADTGLSCRVSPPGHDGGEVPPRHVVCGCHDSNTLELDGGASKSWMCHFSAVCDLGQNIYFSGPPFPHL